MIVEAYPVRSSAMASLRTQYDNALVTPAELTRAEASLALGNERHTIGYELELCPDTLKELPCCHDPLQSNGGLSNEDRLTVGSRAYKAGFVLGTDELYELSSPPSTHPYALYILQRGVQSAGLTPKRPTGMVTEHISIGTVSDGQTEEYVDMLRTIELLGGSTPLRLMQPILTDKPESSYNCRGYYGVSTTIFRGVDGNGWTGNNKRCELRSLQYRSPEQLLLALDASYYLSRGMHAPSESTAHDIYEHYRTVYLEESRRLKLPNCKSVVYGNASDRQVLSDYYEPFAELLCDATSSKPIRDAARTAILSMREELGMDGLWTPFESVSYVRLSRRQQTIQSISDFRLCLSAR